MKSRQIITVIMIFALSGVMSSYAISGQSTPDNFIFIQSRFMLWDTYEKMMDNNFNITLINYENSTMNNSYEIYINKDIYYGNFTGFIILPFMRNESSISIIVKMNNDTKMIESNIRIVKGITPNAIDRIDTSPFITINPLEWGKRQWNIFFAVVFSALVSVLIAYLIVVRYRKFKGVMEIK